MIIKKTAELYFKKNDIYTLENHNNTVIVNDNNHGLLILDNSLNIQKELTLPLEAPIYSLYKKYNNSALILYLPDAHEIVFVDLETSANYTVALPNAFYEEVLSPNYYWDDNVLILVTYNNTFYQFDFSSRTLHQISKDTAKQNCPSFFAFWEICKQYNVVTFYPNEKSFVFQENDNFLGFFNYQQNKQGTITGFTDGWHDVEYKNNLFAFIHENKIEILHDNHKNLLTPQANLIFLKVKFLDDNHFVALSSNPSHYQESLLEVYEITKSPN